MPDHAIRSRRWDLLYPAVRLLVSALTVLTVLEIYATAHELIGRLFGIALLFVFAGILALFLSPVIDRVADAVGGRRAVATLCVYGVLLGGVVLTVLLLLPVLIAEVRTLPDLMNRAEGVAREAQQALDNHGIPIHLAAPSAAPILGASLTILAGTVTTMVDIILVVVISIYFSIQGREIIAALRQLFPQRAHLFDFTLVAIGSTLGGYARGQLLMAAIMGAYTGISMWAIGVHYAVVLGVVAFLLEFLPLLGAPLAMIVATAVALAQSPLLAVSAAALGLLGHAGEAYIVGPRITGHVTRIHPLAAMAALLIGADLGGVIGALFAVPVASLINVFLGAVYRSRRGDEALTTAESGEVSSESLPRLGEEITEVDSAGIVDDPVPRRKSADAG